MKKLICLFLGLFLCTAAYATGVDASSVKVKVYQFAVSESTDCSDPTVVEVISDPEYTEMNGVTLIEDATLADGTYPCVIITMSDHVKFTPATATGSCTVTEITRDVCAPRGDGDDEEAETIHTLSSTGNISTTATCTDAEDQVTIWLTTEREFLTEEEEEALDDAERVNNIMHKPNGTSGGDHLAAALIVDGETVGRFQADFSGKVNGQNEECDLHKPNWGFLNGDVSE